MKKYSIITQLLLSGGLWALGEAQAQESTPPATPSGAAASDAGNSTSISVSDFLRQGVYSSPPGPAAVGKPASVNTVNYLTVDVERSQGATRKLIFSGSIGADWWSLEPGVWPSESLRLGGASVTERFNADDYIKFGTAGFIGPDSGDQRTGYKYNMINSNFFNYAGAQMNLLGIHAGKKIGKGKKFSATFDGAIVTADRVVTIGVAGAPYPGLCHQNDKHGCGLDSSIRIDGESSLILGFKPYFEATEIENKGGLRRERRLTGGGRYARKAGPVTGIVEGDFTQGTHFQGLKPNLNVGSVTFAVEKDLGKKLRVRGYRSETRTQGAIKEDFRTYGFDVTKGGFSADFYYLDGGIRGKGVTISYGRDLLKATIR